MGNNKNMSKIRKGDLVKLNPNDPEIERLLEWKIGVKAYMASRPTTSEEQEEWRVQKHKDISEAHDRGDDTFHIAFDSGGESRLAPRSTQVALQIDGIYIVQRARCRVELGWGNPSAGMTKILDTTTGETSYVKKEMLEKV